MLIAVATAAALGGCAGPGPRLFPVAPLPDGSSAPGRAERHYDTDGNGQADYAEVLGPSGVVRTLRYDTTGDGSFDLAIDLDSIPAGDRRHLILILDSIPFAMVRDIRRQGRFRLFHPPSRVISPFPVMTDPCLAEFFGTSPCPGVESAYFDGRTLRNGYDVYANGGNVPWQSCVDYAMNPVAHAFAYLSPGEWYGHELRRIQDGFHQGKQDRFVGYVVGTSALGASFGRTGHHAGLIRLDRFCQQIVFETRGRVHITLLSDHGHNLVRSERIPLADLLAEFGYRVGTSLDKPGDVVVPEFGMVTCASIYTRNPRQVARDVVGIEGIELAAYRDGDDQVVVLSRDGRACISQSTTGFRYEADYGDPLRLLPIVDELTRGEQADTNGFVSDRVLFEATVSHVYPDVVHRLWRAFHGLIKHTPDVLVSVEDGYHCGSALMSSAIELAAAHGNLRQAGSGAFAMTTAGRLPDVIRMEDLGEALKELDVPVTEQVPATQPK